MFSVEIKVNGALIAHVYGRRIKEDGDRRQWQYEYYEVESREVAKHTIWGNKDMPLTALVRDILNQVMRESSPEI